MLVAIVLQPQGMCIHVAESAINLVSSLCLSLFRYSYTIIGDGNYVTIEYEEQREYENVENCIDILVTEQHEFIKI